MAKPLDPEAHAITTAWTKLELVSQAMGNEPSFELLKVKTLCWQDVRDWFPEKYSLTLAEARAIAEIRKGIEKKLVMGADNDTFHYSRNPSGKDNGREAAYDFGQKLVRWNDLIERRFWDRLLNRKGPLVIGLLLADLKASEIALSTWWARYTQEIDKQRDADDQAI